MSIFNQIPAIAEDTLCYILYPNPADKTSVTTLAACILAFVADTLPALIWHRDPFEVKVVQDPASKEHRWVLEGKMRVGDCVDDEWCVVWLLRELSSRWDVAISVWDSDGDFLLIEAAEVLPRWVSPENSENRVWIYRNRMHLIPLEYVSSGPAKRRESLKHLEDDSRDAHDDVEGWMAPEDAIKLVRDMMYDTYAPEEVQSAVWRKISGYPEMAKNHIHRTKAYLPVDISRALRSNPGLVQKPVESFYTRDSAQLRAAHRMARFPPSPDVLTLVTLTRTAYAQLIGQRFHPPKVYGRWKEAEGTAEYRWRDVGMKIACGFEMLYQESKKRHEIEIQSTDGIQVSADARKEALQRHPDYAQFQQNLVTAGYFRGELQGSLLWNELEEKAATAFIEARREDAASRPSFAAQVSKAIAEYDVPVIHPTVQAEDSDAWLVVDAADFDELLKQTASGNLSSHHMGVDVANTHSSHNRNGADEQTQVQTQRLQNLAVKIEEFVEGEGDLDGALFEDELSSEEKDDLSDESMTNSDDESDGSMNEEEKRSFMNNLVPTLTPQEYGQMPASYYDNSQRIAPTTMETDVIGNIQPEQRRNLSTISEDGPVEESTPANETRTFRKPLIPRDQYDGVDSCDEDSDEEDQGMLRSEHHDESEESEESDEDKPAVVGEIEVDMNAEEAEFVEFSRQALGISDTQWNDILRDRAERGAFIPASLLESHAEKKINVSNPTPKSSGGPSTLSPSSPSNDNPNLNSFESVMSAMDKELARDRKAKGRAWAVPNAKNNAKNSAKSKQTTAAEMADDSGEDVDIETAMENELRAALEGGDGDEEEDLAQYGLIKNFLESFKSQTGLSGPVGSLAGRLQKGWTMPRDDEDGQ